MKMDKEYLMKLVDGGIKDIEYEHDSIKGCPTCDYGSSYITDLTVTFDKYVLKAHTDKMYDFCPTEGYLMKILLQNAKFIESMTEENCCKYLKERIEALKDSEFSTKLKLEVKYERIA